jgi:hypothetical protein
VSGLRLPKRVIIAIALLSGCFGVLLRFFAARGELWLDELWSVLLTRTMETPVDVLSVKHDNNHLLNSLWMWMCGATAPPWLLRFPSLLFAAAAITLLCVECVRRKQQWLTFFTIMFTTSYPFVLYGSEARGYSIMILCVVAGAWALDRLLVAPDRTAAVVFAISGFAGCWAHAAFSLFLVPALLWLTYGVIAKRPNISWPLFVMAALPPLVTGALLGSVFYTQMEIGGGPLLPYVQVVFSTISVSFGGEELSLNAVPLSAWCVIASLFICAVCALELLWWYRENDRRSSLCLLVLAAPAFAITLTHPDFVLTRYFLIQIVALYVLMARSLARLSAKGSGGAFLAACVVCLFALLNLRHAVELIRYGRSHAVEVLAEIARSSNSPEELTVGGDHDNQNALRLDYAKLVEPITRSLAYIPAYESANTAPRYVIRETLDRFEPMPDAFEARGTRYALTTTYPAPLLSGSWWYVYRKQVDGR